MQTKLTGSQFSLPHVTITKDNKKETKTEKWLMLSAHVEQK